MWGKPKLSSGSFDVREGAFLNSGGGGGWAGVSEGRVISKYFTNWGGSNLFYMQLGKGHSSFGKEKITPCRIVDSCSLTNTRNVKKPKSCIYKRSYQ